MSVETHEAVTTGRLRTHDLRLEKPSTDRNPRLRKLWNPKIRGRFLLPLLIFDLINLRARAYKTNAIRDRRRFIPRTPSSCLTAGSSAANKRDQCSGGINYNGEKSQISHRVHIISQDPTESLINFPKKRDKSSPEILNYATHRPNG